MSNLAEKIYSKTFCNIICIGSAAFGSRFVFAQQNVGIGTTTPNTNTASWISTATIRGLLVPRPNLTNTTAASPLGGFVANMAWFQHSYRRMLHQVTMVVMAPSG
ncbi:MAG: hypothetical protein IPP37_17315 [Saprospiraceae bacterium]|nr:hypothetical protein [Saprospiraceae bacterium]